MIILNFLTLFFVNNLFNLQPFQGPKDNHCILQPNIITEIVIFPGEYCSTPGAFLIDMERILAMLPMDELMLPKPDLNKLMAVMPNFEDFEELIIRMLECGGRGTVSGLSC